MTPRAYITGVQFETDFPKMCQMMMTVVAPAGAKKYQMDLTLSERWGIEAKLYIVIKKNTAPR